MTNQSITDYEQIRALPRGTVVQDASGEVWVVKKPFSNPNETWLCPFSDEYAITGPDDVQDLEFPLTNTGIVSSSQG